MLAAAHVSLALSVAFGQSPEAPEPEAPAPEAPAPESPAPESPVLDEDGASEDEAAAPEELEAAELVEDGPVEAVRARQADQDTWMIMTAIASGGHVGAGLTAGARGSWDGQAAWGGVLGAGLGAATVVVLRPDGGYSTDDVALVASGAGLGAWSGHMLARTFIPAGAQGEVGRQAIASVLGNVAGTGLALATVERAPRAGLLLRTDLAALVAWQSAAGAMDLAELDPREDRQVRSAISLASGLGGAGATLALARLSERGPSPALASLSMGHGAWAGLWAPTLLSKDPSGQQIGGGLRLGLGAGYLASVALAPVARPDGRSTGLQVAGIAAGNALGAGLPLAIGVDPEDPKPIVGPMLAGGAAGQLYGALLSRYYTFDPGESAVVSTMGLWTGWQSIGWGFYGARAGQEGSQATGNALTAAGAGTLVAMGAAPLLDITPEGAALAASGGMWGTWYAGWLGTIADMDPDDHWLLTLGASNAALIGSVAAVHGRSPSWLQVGLLDGFGAAGGAGGALLGVVASPDPDVVGACSLAGTTVGLGLGAWRMASAKGARSGGQARLGGLGPIRLKLPTPAVEPFRDVGGESGLWVGVRRDGW